MNYAEIFVAVASLHVFCWLCLLLVKMDQQGKAERLQEKKDTLTNSQFLDLL